MGFDFDGHVKLFDFGLAKELDPMQKTDNGLYTMSGGTGSRRFMAPEVALSEPYNLSADVRTCNQSRALFHGLRS